MEMCEKGSLLDLLKEPENTHGLEEEQYIRVFRDLGKNNTSECSNI